MSALKTYCQACALLSPPIFTEATGCDDEGELACANHGGPKPAPKPSPTESTEEFETAAAITKHQRRLAVKKEESVMAEERALCAEQGCVRSLRSDNSTGYCTPHARKRGLHRKQKPGDAAPKKQSPNGRAATPAAAANGHEATATVCVTETALNRWWEALDIQQKADVFTEFMG